MGRIDACLLIVLTETNWITLIMMTSFLNRENWYIMTISYELARAPSFKLRDSFIARRAYPPSRISNPLHYCASSNFMLRQRSKNSYEAQDNEARLWNSESTPRSQLTTYLIWRACLFVLMTCLRLLDVLGWCALTKAFRKLSIDSAESVS